MPLYLGIGRFGIGGSEVRGLFGSEVRCLFGSEVRGLFGSEVCGLFLNRPLLMTNAQFFRFFIHTPPDHLNEV